MTSYGGQGSSPSGSDCSPYRRARKGATSATSRFWGSRARTIPNVRHRALVVGAGNAGAAHAEALNSIGIEVVGPLSGTATECTGSAAALGEAICVVRRRGRVVAIASTRVTRRAF